MRIQLVGFDFNLNPIQKVEVFREVVNQSKADFILFPGHTLRDEDDLEYLKSRLTNKDSVVVLELESACPTSCMQVRNELYILKNGKFQDMYSCQIFSKASDLVNNTIPVEKLFDEISRRTIECCSKRITILQCGETSLLASSKSENYEASFRFKHNSNLLHRFKSITAKTDIFLNPIHDLQGEQGVMAQRRIALSKSNRYYFSTCALNEEMSGNFNSKRLQYAYYDGKEIVVKPIINEEMGYVSRTFDIK